MIDSKASRIGFLDMLRGVAVMCIFIANIVYFSGLIFIPFDQQWEWSAWPTDELLMAVVYTLVDGKFYTIFSLLFAIGCTVQYQRARDRKSDFKRFFRRRMFWLLVIGMIHLCLIWLGDILTLYAVLGFLLLWFVDVPNKKLLLWAAVLTFLPIANEVLIYDLGYNYPKWLIDVGARVAHGLGNDSDAVTDMQAYLKNQSWETFLKTNLSNSFDRVSRLLAEGRPFKVFGIFLIGLWTGRKILNENLLQNKHFLKSVALWGLGIGLVFSAVRTYVTFTDRDGVMGLWIAITYALGTVPLAMGYAAVLALWYKPGTFWSRIFEQPGRMALTLYLSQTLFGIGLFYGIGFGLAGKLGFTIVLGMALVIFAMQSAVSAAWLKRFGQGPMEKLWRKLVGEPKQAIQS